MFGYGVTGMNRFPRFSNAARTRRCRRSDRQSRLQQRGRLRVPVTLEDFEYLDYDIIVLYEGYNDLPGDEKGGNVTPAARVRDLPADGLLPDTAAVSRREGHDAALRHVSTPPMSRRARRGARRRVQAGCRGPIRRSGARNGQDGWRFGGPPAVAVVGAGVQERCRTALRRAVRRRGRCTANRYSARFSWHWRAARTWRSARNRVALNARAAVAPRPAAGTD